jgi:predicted AAA+ superfamily ATPase
VYRRRILDDELDVLLSGLAAVSIDGPKAVGKTATASVRSSSVYRLDDPAVLEVVRADPSVLTESPTPVVIDEWQRWEPSWDLVRRAVDADASPGRFILTGSAPPALPTTHSGAGRIVSLRMRPLAFAERELSRPTVSLRALLDGSDGRIEGRTTVGLADYVDAIVGGGFPGMQGMPSRVRRTLLAGYVDRIVDRDFDEAGLSVRNPGGLRRWLMAYAAATGTTTSMVKVREAATAGAGTPPARTTTHAYLETLERIWIADPVPGYVPTNSQLNRLTTGPKLYLTDPALAVTLLRLDAATLLAGGTGGVEVSRDGGSFLGALFESLVALDVRVAAQAAEATVSHVRTRAGDHEVDFLVQGPGGRSVAIEVKLAANIESDDVKHLHWLKDKLRADLVDLVVITTGTTAYRREDGVAVVPLALLGP